MSLDLAGPIRTAILASDPVVSALVAWEGEPAVFTRRPVPADATYPLIVVSPDISTGNQDMLKARISTPRRDISVYGAQPDDYRTVEAIAYALRDLFHRNRFAIAIDGVHVLDIVANGPVSGPTDDPKLVCRLVPLILRLQTV
jgi:hypothetical protein